MFTVIQPYYNHQITFKHQLRNWTKLTKRFGHRVQYIVIDDGSPDFPIWKPDVDFDLRVFRIVDDIPWNTVGAANLGFHQAKYDWVMHLDMDYMFLESTLQYMLNIELDPETMYQPFVHYQTYRYFKVRPPHCNSYLLHKSMFEKAGGYDEDFAGHWGGGDSFFLHRLKEEGIKIKTIREWQIKFLHNIRDARVKNVNRKAEPNNRLFEDKVAGRKRQNSHHLNFTWREL